MGGTDLMMSCDVTVYLVVSKRKVGIWVGHSIRNISKKTSTPLVESF